MKKHLWWSLALAGLTAGNAGAVEFFVPVPNLGVKSLIYSTEFSRQDLSKDDVTFTYVAEGQSGLNATPQGFKVLPGPSTSSTHPLLTDNYSRDYRRPPDRSQPKWYLPGGGLVVMQGEQGLLGIETGVAVGSDPTSAWELPMLTHDDGFKPGRTAYVLDMAKDALTASQLSLFNFDNTPSQCQTRLLSPKGSLIEQRAGIAVPARGAVRIADILKPVTAAAALSVAVTCDRTFYAMGSFPASALTDIRVHYPSTDPPTLGERQILVSDVSFRVTHDLSVQTFSLPLDPEKRYRSVLLDFDATVASPSNSAFYRGLVGMWRNEPGQRFGKTLYFGINERFDRSKLLIDLGTPYIEYLTKKGNAALVGGRIYHFHIEVNADQKSIRQLVTNGTGGVVADIRSGIFNDDLRNRNGNTLVVGFGLPGIGDGAYSPPYGWRFSKITISGYK
jgi:hypothetical protein